MKIYVFMYNFVISIYSLFRGLVLELYNANFDLSIEAKKIDNKFSGLKWISPYYKNNPSEEIDSIKKIKYAQLQTTDMQQYKIANM